MLTTARALLLTAAASMLLFPAAAQAQSKLDDRLDRSGAVLEELRRIPEGAIPPALLDRAYAVAILPDMIKLGVGVAGRHGKGVLAVRGETGWSNPVFIKLTGGSVGWQAGLQTSDIVLVFTNERGLRNITTGKLTLGADASIAAGPVGRNASAATDGRFRAEVYSYSRARGLFAGIALDGAALRIDDAANATFYVAPGITADGILAGPDGDVPDSAVKFMRQLPGSGVLAVAEASAAPSEVAATVSGAPTEARTFALGERAADEDDASDED
ncbi:MAG: lipid-binding SYLF domain-containing protein [Pseudomonadota bacterium]